VSGQVAEIGKVYKIVALSVKTAFLDIDSCLSKDKSIHLASRELGITPK
jgi:hypothetical protein